MDWGRTAAFFKTEEPGPRHIQNSFTPTPVTIHAEPHGPHGRRGQTKQASTTYATSILANNEDRFFQWWPSNVVITLAPLVTTI